MAAYKTFVPPTVDYGSSIYDLQHGIKSQISQLKFVKNNNKAERFACSGWKKSVIVSAMRDELDMTTLQTRLCIIHKVYHSLVTIPIDPLYLSQVGMTTHGAVRKFLDLHKPYCRIKEDHRNRCPHYVNRPAGSRRLTLSGRQILRHAVESSVLCQNYALI